MAGVLKDYGDPVPTAENREYHFSHAFCITKYGGAQTSYDDMS